MTARCRRWAAVSLSVVLLACARPAGPAPASWRASGALKTILVTLVLLALLALASNFLFRKAVARKTRELRRREERLHFLLERNQAGVYRTTFDGRFRECNEAFANLLGYPSREAVMALNAVDLYVDPSQRQTVVERILREKQLTGEILRLKRKDGEEVWAMVNETLIEAPGQEPLFEGVLVDITERKRAEAALAESEAVLQCVLAAAADGILAVDSQRRVVHANRRFAEIWRIPQDLLESGNDKALLDFVLSQLAAPEAFLAKVEALYGSDREEMDTLIFAGGRVVERYSAPMKSGDSVTGRVWSFRDVTERKRAEERLRQADLEREKARSAEAVAQLIQGLAHEIRDPLFAINVNAAVLEKETSAVPGAAERIAFVMKNVGRLDALMRDLLELGRQPLAGEMAECLPRDVAHAAVLAAEAQAPEAAGRVLVEAPERPFIIRALPNRLKRALVHLILNALQNSPPNGRVRVRAGQAGGQAFVEVGDEGPGIPLEIRDRLFEPFVTTHMGRRGLGLALAKHYVTAMGGTLEAANNDPPPGATFTVRLPLP